MIIPFTKLSFYDFSFDLCVDRVSLTTYEQLCLFRSTFFLPTPTSKHNLSNVVHLSMSCLFLVTRHQNHPFTANGHPNLFNIPASYISPSPSPDELVSIKSLNHSMLNLVINRISAQLQYLNSVN